MSSSRNGSPELPLGALPLTFTYSEARRSGVSDRTLYALRDAGLVENLGRGLYRRTDIDTLTEIDLVEVARRAPGATLCLTSALARHGLTDEIPAAVDAALPRGQHRPLTSVTVTWHMFDRTTFDIGREELMLDRQTAIGLYGPERSIIDAMRLRHREGSELAITALKRWLRRPGTSPSNLLAMASRFPQAEKALRQALAVLL